MRAKTQLFTLEPELEVPLLARLHPIVEPLVIGTGLTKELELHLLELARAKGKIARVDLVAKRFTNLRDAERHLDAGRVHHVGKVGKNPLRGLGSQIGLTRRIGER